MRDPFRTAALALVFSLIASSCAAAPAAPADDADPEGEITTPVQRLPDRIDPLSCCDYEQWRHISMVFEGLMTLDPSRPEPVPAAARQEPQVSADGRTYTFTLRDGLKYSDGSTLRASDFAYALARVCDPEARHPSALAVARMISGCESVKRLDPEKASAAEVASAKAGVGLRATSDLELIIVLAEPAAYFPAIVALPIAFPVRETDIAKVGSEYGTPTALASLVGNGPFRLVAWTPDQRVVFERNDEYRAPAKLKRWTKVIVPLDVALAAYRNGEIDFFGGVPSQRVASVNENLAAIEADPQMRSEIVNAGPAGFTDFFVLNPSRPPFSDRSVRQAFAKAIDRGQVVRDFLTFSAPALSLIPPGRPGHDAGDTFQALDARRALELLQTSTFAHGPELRTIKFTYAVPSDRTPAEFLQQQVKRSLGVEIALESVGNEALAAMYRDPRTAPQISFRRAFEVFADPHAWFLSWHSGSGHAATVGYASTQLDALIEQGAVEQDPVRRADIYRRASRTLSEDAVLVWFIWPANVYLRKARVKGVADTPRDFEYGLSRLTEMYVTKRTP